MWRSSVRIGTNLGVKQVLIYRYIFSGMALYTVPESDVYVGSARSVVQH